MKQKGILIVISGFSGAGKGTLVKALLQKYDGYALSVSMTTRAPRPGERDGVEYFFSTREEFEKAIAEDGLVEYATYCDNYYGTPRYQVLEKMETGHVLLDIEPKGAEQVKRNMPEAILIFIMPPSVEELERRLRGRGDTSEDQIEKRMKRAVWEMDQRVWYDHVLVNEDAEVCADEILKIIADKA